MSAASDHKHYGITTTLIAVAVALALYVLTWPIIELDYFRPLPKPTPEQLSAMDLGVRESRIEKPVFSTRYRWTNTFYHPLHLWRDSNEGDNLLCQYWEWWFRRLWRDPFQ